MRRWVLAIWVTVAVATAGVSAPPVSAVPGLCMGGILDNYQIFVRKFASDAGGGYMDSVQGDAYVRQLYSCPTPTFSAVLPANVQNGATFQAGYGVLGSSSTLQFAFADAAAGQPPYAQWVTAVYPVLNSRYRFIIYRTPGYTSPTFKIQRYISGSWSTVWQMFSWTYWGSDVVQAWWGYETSMNKALHGSYSGAPTVDMAYMGYSTSLSSSTSWRSGLNSHLSIDQETCYGGPTYCVNGVWVDADWFPDVDSDHNTHYSIGTWVFGGDKFSVDAND